MSTENSFKRPNPGDDDSRVAYACLDVDLLFGNTSPQWFGAFKEWAAECGGAAAKIRELLSNRDHKIRDEYGRAKYGDLPAGSRVGELAEFDGPKSLFMLASRAHYYLKRRLREDLERGEHRDYRCPSGKRV